MFRHPSRVSIELYVTDRRPSAMATPAPITSAVAVIPETQVKRILCPATKGGAPRAAVKTLIATAKSGLGTN